MWRSVQQHSTSAAYAPSTPRAAAASHHTADTSGSASRYGSSAAASPHHHGDSYKRSTLVAAVPGRVRSTTPVRSAAGTTPRAAASPQAAAPASSNFMTQVSRDKPTPQAVSRVQRPMSASRNIAPSYAASRSNTGLLPPHRHDQRMLLVLDMDETLLHAAVNPVQHDVSFVVHMETGQSVPVYVKFRPHLTRFLEAVSRLFEVAVFTASIPRYANQVLDYIDPSGSLVHHRLFRQHCSEVDGTYVKDLEQLGRPLDRISIVDNSPAAYSFHPQNAVAISSWFDDDSDRALHDLLPFLERMAYARDVYGALEEIRRRRIF